MAYPFLMGIGDSVSPGYAAFNSSRHQLSGIARESAERLFRPYASSYPRKRVNLTSLSVEVNREHVVYLENRRSRRGAKRDLSLYEALTALFQALTNHGRHAEAADAAREALRHASNVFRSDKLNDRKPLGAALSNAAVALRRIGQFDEALETSQQAEAIWRELARKQPDALNAFWAASLNNLGSHLWDVGRFDEALETSQEAEAIRRELARKQPDAFNADWAASLNNLSGYLGQVGCVDEALGMAQQAEAMYCELARKQPDAFNADWATVLVNLGIRLEDLGQFEQALQKAQQAETIFSELARKQPDTFNADWAKSLEFLGW